MHLITYRVGLSKIKSNEMYNVLVVRCDNKTCITDGTHHVVLGHYTVGSNNARKATYLLRLVVIHLLAQRFTVYDSFAIYISSLE